MTLRDVGIGVKLDIEVLYPDDSNIVKMVSQLVDVEDENTALIAAPMAEGMFHILKRGTRISAFFVIKLDVYRLELYAFNAMVVGSKMDDNILLFRIRLLGEIERKQRREYYRAECSLEIRVALVELDENREEITGDAFKTITRNLSGGGVCILLRDKIPVRSIIKCMLSLGKKTIPFKGKVVRVSPYDYQGVYNYEAGVSFIDINDMNREEIIKFIFREQRRLRRRGLI
jgi:c-di-GMP-binding flagellar brake protein YcgR